MSGHDQSVGGQRSSLGLAIKGAAALGSAAAIPASIDSPTVLKPNSAISIRGRGAEPASGRQRGQADEISTAMSGIQQPSSSLSRASIALPPKPLTSASAAGKAVPFPFKPKAPSSGLDTSHTLPARLDIIPKITHNGAGSGGYSRPTPPSGQRAIPDLSKPSFPSRPSSPSSALSGLRQPMNALQADSVGATSTSTASSPILSLKGKHRQEEREEGEEDEEIDIPSHASRVEKTSLAGHANESLPVKQSSSISIDRQSIPADEQSEDERDRKRRKADNEQGVPSGRPASCRKPEISLQGRALGRGREQHLPSAENANDDYRRHKAYNDDDDDRKYSRHGGGSTWDTGSPSGGRYSPYRYNHGRDNRHDERDLRYDPRQEHYWRQHYDPTYHSDSHRPARGDYYSRRSRSRSPGRDSSRRAYRDGDGDSYRQSDRAYGERYRSPRAETSYARNKQGTRVDSNQKSDLPLQVEDPRVDDWDEPGHLRRDRLRSPRSNHLTPMDPGAPRHPSRELAGKQSVAPTPYDHDAAGLPPKADASQSQLSHDTAKQQIPMVVQPQQVVATPFFLQSPTVVSEPQADKLLSETTPANALDIDVAPADVELEAPASEPRVLPSLVERQYVLFGSSQLDDYILEEKVGEGTFGVVHKAIRKTGSVRQYPTGGSVSPPLTDSVVCRKKRSWKLRARTQGELASGGSECNEEDWQRSKVREGQVVALKKIVMHNDLDGVPITALREIRILKSLDHPNIVPLVDMAFQPGDYDALRRGTVYMVFPYMAHDLAGLLENRKIERLEPSLLKLYARQLLDGTSYLHSNNILHRDMKAANLLIADDGRLQIADFGLARSIEQTAPDKTREYTNCVVTRWYRPPELLLGLKAYGKPIDMWGVACVIGEMFFRHPIFTGSSDINQVACIVQMCGTIDEISMPGLAAMPESRNIQLNPAQRVVVPEFTRFSAELADLMDKLLVLDPAGRLTADEALDHDWFWTYPLPAEIGNIDLFPSSHEYDKRKVAENQEGRGGDRGRAAQQAAFRGPNELVKLPPQVQPQLQAPVPMAMVSQAQQVNGQALWSRPGPPQVSGVPMPSTGPPQLSGVPMPSKPLPFPVHPVIRGPPGLPPNPLLGRPPMHTAVPTVNGGGPVGPNGYMRAQANMPYANGGPMSNMLPSQPPQSYQQPLMRIGHSIPTRPLPANGLHQGPPSEPYWDGSQRAQPRDNAPNYHRRRDDRTIMGGAATRTDRVGGVRSVDGRFAGAYNDMDESVAGGAEPMDY